MKNLEGRNGWLFFYIIAHILGLIFAALQAHTTAWVAVYYEQMSEWTLIYLWVDVIVGFVIWITLFVTSEWVITVQKYWLTYKIVMVFLFSFSSADPYVEAVFAIYPAAWLWYWIVSKRIKATYFDKPKPELELTLID